MKQFLVLLCMIAFGAAAQEFSPHPRAKITPEQWQSYLDEVKAKHGGTERQFLKEHLVTYDDRKSSMTWAFTTVGHPAHPAWVTRMPVEDQRGVSIRQIGYFAGDESEFARLFKAFESLNDRIREKFKSGESGK